MSKTKKLVCAAMVAAMYVALTLISASVGLASGAIQLRISEALVILPCFMPEAIAGLTLGCAISNLLTGCALWDIVFGSLATLLGAVLTYLFRKNRWLAPVFPILANAAVIPPVLMLVYGSTGTYWYLLLTVAAGEIISCGIFGQLLYSAVKKVMKQKSE